MTGAMLLVLFAYAGIAIALGVIAVAVWLVFVYGFDRIAARFENRPKRLVRRVFAEKYPNESIAWLKVASTEPTRWVVGIYFGSRIPPRYKFFSVDRSTEEVAELDDDSAYAPEGWR